MAVRNESHILFLYSSIGFLCLINTHMHACLHHYHSPYKHTFDLYNTISLCKYISSTHTETWTLNWAPAGQFSGFKIPTEMCFIWERKKARIELICSILAIFHLTLYHCDGEKSFQVTPTHNIYIYNRGAG